MERETGVAAAQGALEVPVQILHVSVRGFLASPRDPSHSQTLFHCESRPKIENISFQALGYSLGICRGKVVKWFKNILVPQPYHPLPGRRWFSKILERAGLAQSTAYEALVARARTAMAPAASALGPRERPATNEAGHAADR